MRQARGREEEAEQSRDPLWPATAFPSSTHSSNSAIPFWLPSLLPPLPTTSLILHSSFFCLSFILFTHLGLTNYHATISSMASSANDLQERLAAARREADSLKEKIRAQREGLADTTRTSLLFPFRPFAIWTDHLISTIRRAQMSRQSVPSQLKSNPFLASSCVLAETFAVTSPKSMPCIGPPTFVTSSLPPKTASSSSGMRPRPTKSTLFLCAPVGS